MGVRVVRKKSDKEVRKEAKLKKTKKQIKEDPTRNSNRTKRKLKKLDKTAKQLGAIKIAAGGKPPVDYTKMGVKPPVMMSSPFSKQYMDKSPVTALKLLGDLNKDGTMSSYETTRQKGMEQGMKNN